MSDKLDDIADLYSKSLAEHGPAAKGVGWGDTDSHNIRFEKLLQCMGAGPPLRPTFNDLGCGYAALYTYLIERGIAVGRYRGHDISAPMLEEARIRVSAPEVEFVESANLDQAADYAIASGIFNVRFERTEEAWLDFILSSLRNLNEFSTRGFAFNLLTTYVDYRRDHLYYGDPTFFFDFCKREFSPRVALLHDYPLYEWTIAVVK
ncbi:MAG: class I SAM-dependent methyltransferase [Alphaproteobacteria bacterium]|nr:class I SAM-dependent methyltransferase [Alphaproteobacteria bacterium]